MLTQATLSGDGKPSRSGFLESFLLAALAALGLVVTSFNYGSSAHEAIEHDNAIAVAHEDQTFCVGLGLTSGTGTYRKCITGLNEIRVHYKDRLDLESAGLL